MIDFLKKNWEKHLQLQGNCRCTVLIWGRIFTVLIYPYCMNIQRVPTHFCITFDFLYGLNLDIKSKILSRVNLEQSLIIFWIITYILWFKMLLENKQWSKGCIFALMEKNILIWLLEKYMKSIVLIFLHVK